MAAAVTGTIGLAAALFARPWIGLFTDDAEAIAAGARYLQLAGPAYAVIGLGLASRSPRRGLEGVAVAAIAALAVYAITHAMPWLPRQAWRDAESAP
jgi:Na+-driven multidrug efflux pump